MWCRRHKLNSTVTRTFLLMMCTTEYGFIEISGPIKVKDSEHLLGTMVLVSQVITTSLVHIQLCLHDPFQQWTISYWTITHRMMLWFLLWPRRQQSRPKTKQTWTLFQSHFTAHSATLLLTKCQPELWYGHLLFQQSNLPQKYNLSSFHSFSPVHLHLSSYVLYVSERCEETSALVTRWRHDREACEVQQ